MGKARARIGAIVAGVLVAALAMVCFTGCSGSNASQSSNGDTKVITDMRDRTVEIPANVESIVCASITLRQVSYLGAQDLVVGVEEGELKDSVRCPYRHVNYEKFKDYPVIGEGGDAVNEEAIVELHPDVIIVDEFDAEAANALQERTGIPVVACDLPELVFDEKYYENLKLLGETLNKQERATQLIEYIEGIEDDLSTRASKASGPAPTGYPAAITWSGGHGFEGTEADFTPFNASMVVNISDNQGSEGCFDIDMEKVLEANPEYIFIEINNLDLVLDQVKQNPEYFKSLQAVQNGKVYSLNSVRMYSTNMELMLANCYQVGINVYPDEFKDVDPNAKLDEITQFFLGANFADELKAEGFEFRQIDLLAEAENYTPKAS